MGTTIYFENLNNHRFISLRRPLAGRPIVDLNFLLNDIAIRTKPLDAARVLSSLSPLTVMATDVRSAARAPLRDFEDAGALFGAMRAGATMPVVAGPPVTFRGRTYLDASLTEPIPVPIAEADGCTHALVLLTRPTETARKTTAFDRAYVLPRLRRLSPALADLYSGRASLMPRCCHALPPAPDRGAPATVMGIRPAPPPISKLERSAERLTAGARSGHEAVMRAFGRIPS
jgi:predicted patatin/cPLA2 family phospholipase